MRGRPWGSELDLSKWQPLQVGSQFEQHPVAEAGVTRGGTVRSVLDCREPCLERRLCQNRGIEQSNRRGGLAREMEKREAFLTQEVNSTVPHFPSRPLA